MLVTIRSAGYAKVTPTWAGLKTRCGRPEGAVIPKKRNQSLDNESLYDTKLMQDHPWGFGRREEKPLRGLFHLQFDEGVAVRTNVYIDGFNLYNGAVRKTPYKWLDIGALCNALLPGRTIRKIRYFTAAVIGFPHDPQAPTRQDTCLRALSTIPSLSIHKDGWFTAHAVLYPQFPLAILNPKWPPLRVQVQKVEEKRTDVDLATHLLIDGFSNDYDEAVVISNDSDLVLPIEMMRTKYGKRMGVINPHPRWKQSGHLKRAADFHIRTINRTLLKRCQFPTSLLDAQGKTITKPVSW